LAFSHFFGHLFHRYKLPRVIGEISGGFLLGPTVLGFFLPTVHNWLFNAFPVEGKLISIVYWFGLVLLMFISGFEIQKSFSGGDRKLILAVLLGSTLVPFPAGWIAPFVYDFSPYIGTKNNALALQIVRFSHARTGSDHRLRVQIRSPTPALDAAAYAAPGSAAHVAGATGCRE